MGVGLETVVDLGRREKSHQRVDPGSCALVLCLGGRCTAIYFIAALDLYFMFWTLFVHLLYFIISLKFREQSRRGWAGRKGGKPKAAHRSPLWITWQTLPFCNQARNQPCSWRAIFTSKRQGHALCGDILIWTPLFCLSGGVRNTGIKDGSQEKGWSQVHFWRVISI